LILPTTHIDGRMLFTTVPGSEINLIRSLANNTIEWSGRFGKGWVLATSGDETETRYLSGKGKSWHTHPSGDSRFSLEDWILFLLDSADSHVLATAENIRTYRKRSVENINIFSQQRIGLNPKVSWKLNVARFGKYLCRSQDLDDPYGFLEDVLCKNLGIIVGQD